MNTFAAAQLALALRPMTTPNNISRREGYRQIQISVGFAPGARSGMNLGADGRRQIQRFCQRLCQRPCRCPRQLASAGDRESEGGGWNQPKQVGAPGGGRLGGSRGAGGPIHRGPRPRDRAGTRRGFRGTTPGRGVRRRRYNFRSCRRTARGAKDGPVDTELGIIPRGTGGDFRRTLDLPTDVALAAAHIRDRPARLIDAAHVHYTTADGGIDTRYFINVASFGFSSAVAARANRSSKTLGAKVAFLGATLKTLIAYQNTDVILEMDGGPPVRRTLMLAAIGNGRYFGGGMKICPDATLDSGVLSVVLVGDLGKWETITNMPRLFAGTHLAMEDVRATTVHTLRATPAELGAVIPVELDGETPGHLPATFEVEPLALRVRF